MAYDRYQSLKKLGHAEVDGLLDGLAHIFPKLDGTNGHIWSENGEICFGSRNRQVSLENDNQGFMAALHDSPKLKEFFDKYPNYSLYGEWLVKHTFKDYIDSAWNKFYIFDVYDRANDRYLNYDEYKSILDILELDYIPCVIKVLNGTEEKIGHHLNKSIFLCKEGIQMGEGIVIKNYPFRNKFGNTIWAKLVTNEFKAMHWKAMDVGISEGTKSGEQEFIEKACTTSLLEKEKAKIAVSEGSFENKHIQRFFGVVYYCLLSEELPSFVVKYKRGAPIIDFKKLKRLADLECRKFLGL